jgi:hypothetical protein
LPGTGPSFCGEGECIEVGEQNGPIVLRDSKEPHSAVIRSTAEEWRAFVSGVKAGEFDDLGSGF